METRRDILRFGLVGAGAAGTALARELTGGKVPGACLAAVCDCPERAAALAAAGSGAAAAVFADYSAMLASGTCDAVIVATPHRLHVEQSLAALAAGLDLFCEKPAGVDVASVRGVIAAAAAAGRCYVVNFNRRILPEFQALRALVASGGLGRLQRVHWTSTNWLRTQDYFDSSSWRGTWAGEGGGVLLNQCPHMLDMWQWLCGMPCRLQAQVAFGKYHDIEVEDEVTALAQYPSGATGVFVASTGEYPGSQRVELTGDRGRAVLENERLTVATVDPDLGTFIRGATGFSAPPVQQQETVFAERPDIVGGLLRNFVAAWRGEAELLVPGREAVASLELANAMILSQWLAGPVELPLDGELYARRLGERAAASRPRQAGPGRVLDLRQSLRL